MFSKQGQGKNKQMFVVKITISKIPLVYISACLTTDHEVTFECYMGHGVW